MRGLHAARAVLLVLSFGCCEIAGAGQTVRAPDIGYNSRGPALSELEATKAPGGWVDLCRRDSSFCRPVNEVQRTLILSTDHWALLSRVNTEVNRRITPTTDMKLYGKAEYWAIPTTAGDCEDFVLLKRQILMKLGMRENELLITVVHDENGEGHAVLTVPTNEGDVVLDNRRDDILHWWQTGYKYIKRQSEADPMQWVSLGREKLQATDIASGPEAKK